MCSTNQLRVERIAIVGFSQFRKSYYNNSIFPDRHTCIAPNLIKMLFITGIIVMTTRLLSSNSVDMG